jgi:protein-disulfide isomerase
MQKILLVLAAFLLAAPVLARADAPTLAPDDRVLGNPAAPNIIFEYASLTCPHCARFDLEVLPKLKAAWIDTGRAMLVFRDFPLDGPALYGAMLARCAPPDRFFTFIDVLFQSQDGWGRAKNVNEVKTALTRIGQVGGLSEQQISTCLNDEKLQDSIIKERQDANHDYGVNSTPTFFINGTKLEGEHPLEAFEKYLHDVPPPAAAPAAPAAPDGEKH